MNGIASRMREVSVWTFAETTKSHMLVKGAEEIEKLEGQLDEAIEGWRQAIAIAKAGRT